MSDLFVKTFTNFPLLISIFKNLSYLLYSFEVYISSGLGTFIFLIKTFVTILYFLLMS